VSETRGPRARRSAQEPRPRRSFRPFALPVFGLIVVVALVWLGIAIQRFLAPAGSSLVVPTFVGMQFADAVDSANAAGVRLHVVERRPDARAPKDAIVGQLPAAGEHVREGRIVDVVVSDGQMTAKVPNVTDMSVRDATVTLENARLTLGAVTSSADAAIADGTVLSQKPEAFADVPAGTPVALTVARGRPAEYAPNFVGLSIAAANAAAKSASIALGPAVQMPLAPSAPPKGIVVGQQPTAGEQMRPNETITLQVSGGAPPTPAPSASPFAPPSPQSTPTPTPAVTAQPSPTSLLPAPTAPRGMRVSVALPQSPTPVRIRVVLLDASGSKTLYDQQTLGGFTLSFDLTVTGAGTLETYVGDSLVNSTPL
jgi:eukaryotic-like serine/threonine-protein kinase